MSGHSDDHGISRYDRNLLLHGSKRNEVLSLSEMQRYGADSFGDQDYIKV